MKAMSTETASLQKRSFNQPDEVRAAGSNGEGRIVGLHGVNFAQVSLQPGWKWSESVKPIAKTDSCQAAHHGVVVSGRLHTVMDDGTQEELGAGDIYYIAPGHDAWVVGNEAYVAVDIVADDKWAKPA
jgi:mannose-6-phosphate isomerase-like protein (cupin superfamily)